MGSSVEVRTLSVSMSLPFNHIYLHTIGPAHILKADQTQVSKMLFSHAILISIPSSNFSRAKAIDDAGPSEGLKIWG